jgi:hypothetical protein
MSRHQPINTRMPMIADDMPATVETFSKAATARSSRCGGTEVMSGRALTCAEDRALPPVWPTVVRST